jgi:hypothetical protein
MQVREFVSVSFFLLGDLRTSMVCKKYATSFDLDGRRRCNLFRLLKQTKKKS